MKVIIAGSRDAPAHAVRRAIEECPWSGEISLVISGTASGADLEGEKWAEEHGIQVERYPAPWRAFGRGAGPVRNKKMAENADALIAVWDGRSRGTEHMIELAREHGMRVFVFRYETNKDMLIGERDNAALPRSSNGQREHRQLASGSGSDVASRSSRVTPSHRTHPTSSHSSNRAFQGSSSPFARYRMNALLAWFPVDAKVRIDCQPYCGPDHLNELRERLRQTHAVKRLRNSIEIVAYDTAVKAAVKLDEVQLISRPDLAQYLLREWLARSLAKYHVRRGPGGMISYVSERPESNLLREVLPPDVRLPAGIGRRIAADFDVRRIRNSSGQTRFVILIDVRTRITIDCPLSMLLEVGLDPRGLYVQREVGTISGVRRRLVGRVRAIEASTLILEDHDPEVPVLPISAAWLEPRKENLEQVIKAVAGLPRAETILTQLHACVAERLGGKARPALIDEWVAAIRRFPNDVVQGIRVKLDHSVMRADSGRFPHFEVYDKPQLVFDVGRTKTSTWNQAGLDRHGPYNFERFAPRRLHIALICQASKQGDVEQFVKKLLDGIPGSQYAENGFLRRYHLERPVLRIFPAKSADAKEYRAAVATAIDDATTRNERWHLALVQTEEAFHSLRGDANPYLLTKALFLSHQVPTQAFEWESIRPGVSIDATVNNIGLAIYAKVNGTPWLLPVHQMVAHELVIGLGSFEASTSRLGRREKYIGVATVFSADGRYMLESRTPATPADEYLPALLAALERVVGEVRRSQGWSDDQPVRFIFHVFKDFNQREIEAVKQLVTKLHLPHAEFAFIHLIEDHPFMLFDDGQEGIGSRVPKGVAAAPRGLRVDLGQNEVLLCLKGPRELRQWSDGIPRPVLLNLHSDSTFKDLSYLSRQVFDFTCLSWRTLSSSSLPITVHYADLVAKLLLRLRDVSLWTPETILGPVGRGRWFL